MNTQIKFKNLFAAIKAENETRLTDFKNSVNEETEIKAILNKWQYADLLTQGAKRKQWESVERLKAYLISRNEKATDKANDKALTRLQTVSEAPDLKEISVTMEWKRSRMWGSNPSAQAKIYGADYFDSFESGSVGGYGYDKGSTAVANAINQSNSFLKAMYLIKETQPLGNNRDIFGYGSGYGILPNLEGGVGVSCYPAIFDKIGFNFKTIASGKTFDAYSITKKD